MFKEDFQNDRVIATRRIDKSLPLPAAEPGAAAFDLPCREDVDIEPGRIGVVPLNSVVKVPEGHFLLLAVRSSTPLKRGLVLANGIGIIDPFYCGNEDEIVVQLLNITKETVKVKRGDCIAQGLLMRVEQFRWREVESMNFQRDGGIGYDLREVREDVISA